MPIRTIQRTWERAPAQAPAASGGGGATSEYLDLTQVEYAPEALSVPQGLVPISFQWTSLMTGYGTRVGSLYKFTVPFAASLVAMEGDAQNSVYAKFNVYANGVPSGGQLLIYGQSGTQLFNPTTYTFKAGTVLSVYANVTTGGGACEVVLFVAQGSTT